MLGRGWIIGKLHSVEILSLSGWEVMNQVLYWGCSLGGHDLVTGMEGKC